MTLVGREFLVGLAWVAAVLLAGGGLFLGYLDIERPGRPGDLRVALTVLARRMMTLSITGLGRETLVSVGRSVDRFVYYWFEQSERNLAVSAAFTGIVLLGIPIAAVINLLRDGSPFVVILVLCCLAGFAGLAVLSETRRAPVLASLIAVLLFATMFIFLPGYVFWSLTDRVRHMSPGVAAFMAFVIAPMLYLACQSVVLSTAGTWGALVPSAHATKFRHFVTVLVAAIPLSYLALFIGFLAGQTAVPDLPQPTEWRHLITGVTTAAVSAASTVSFAGQRRATVRGTIFKSLLVGIALCYLAAWIVGFTPGMDTIVVGALFWMVHLPLIPPIMLVVVLVLAVMFKGILSLIARWMDPDVAVARPYLVSGVLMLVLATCAGWAAAIL
jgi:hypothetical protein